MLDLGKDLAVVGVLKPRLLALVAGLVLMLAGCSGGDPEPKMAPTQSVASTPSTSPPTVPPSDDDRRPLQIVRAFVEAQNHALRMGDTAQMKALSSDGCRGCSDFTEPIEQVYADGGSFEGGLWTLVGARAKGATRGSVTVDAAVRIAGGRTIVEAGSEPVEYPVDHRIMVFKLNLEDSQWRISFIGFLS